MIIPDTALEPITVKEATRQKNEHQENYLRIDVPCIIIISSMAVCYKVLVQILPA